MSVQRDGSERRYVQAEVEVPGSPEEVWRALVTGPGISAWFVPAEVDVRVGGEMKLSFGPGMDSISKITELDAPRRLVADSKDLGPDGPTVATEWSVEAKSGGTCIVRVVHSLFADSTDWDNELEAWEAGWPDFFRILKLYLGSHAGKPSALMQLSSMVELSPSEAWAKLCDALGASGLGEGDHRTLGPRGLTPLQVHVEHVGKAPNPEELLLRTGDSIPGITHWFALKMGDRTMLSLRFFVYDKEAKQIVQRIGPDWEAWLAAEFPTQES